MHIKPYQTATEILPATCLAYLNPMFISSFLHAWWDSACCIGKLTS